MIVKQEHEQEQSVTIEGNISYDVIMVFFPRYVEIP